MTFASKLWDCSKQDTKKLQWLGCKFVYISINIKESQIFEWFLFCVSLRV